MAAASGSQSTLDGRVRNHSSYLTVSTFTSLVPGPHPYGDRRSVALGTITINVGVVNTSYPLLSAYFLTT